MASINSAWTVMVRDDISTLLASSPYVDEA